MAQTSVHLKACDISASETHNKREKELDYVRKDLSHLNESFSYIGHSLKTELANIKREVKEKTGRKLYKNAIPIKEGVIVIDSNTTMEDLQKYCSECQRKFGIAPLQIHIHRDEGHRGSKTWNPNLHAHIVWSMYGRDGRNVRLSKDDCREMQTIAAHVLHMERGKSSSKKHLSSLQYKIQELETRLEESNIAIERLKGAFEGAKQGVSDVFTGKARKRAEEAEERAKKAEKTAKEAIDQKTMAEGQKDFALLERDQALEDKRNFISSNSEKLERIDKYINDVNDAKNELKQLKNSINWREKMIEKFVEFGATLRDQWNALFKGEIVQSQHIQINGMVVPLHNPIKLRLNKSKDFEIYDQHWVSEQGFWNGLKKGLTDAFDIGSKLYSWVRQQIGGQGLHR